MKSLSDIRLSVDVTLSLDVCTLLHDELVVVLVHLGNVVAHQLTVLEVGCLLVLVVCRWLDRLEGWCIHRHGLLEA